MTSKVQIANRAMHKLGAKRITDLATDNTKQSKLINEMFDSVRDSELQKHFWSFAKKRVSLASDASYTSVYDWDYAYEKPSDYISMFEVQNNTDYSVEGSQILSNVDSELKITYIRRIVDTTQFHPLFVEALASRLAYECAESITQSNTKKAEAARDYKDAILEAKRANAIELPPEPFQETDDSWLMSRGDGSGTSNYS